MKPIVLIVGAIPGDPSRGEVLRLLNERSPDVEWQWLSAMMSHPLPPANQVNKAIARLRHSQCRGTTVVKLFSLDSSVSHQFFKLVKRPVLVPAEIDSIESFLDWAFSADANLVPRTDWLVNEREAALLAVLSKLLRRKYWNDSVGGHRWLKESPLINQDPVCQPGLAAIRRHALELIPRMLAVELLLTKGSGQREDTQGIFHLHEVPPRH